MSVRGAIDTPWRGASSGSLSPRAEDTGGVGMRLERVGVENGFVPVPEVEGRDASGDEGDERDPRRWSPRRSDRCSSLMKNGDSAGNLTPCGRLGEVGMAREKCYQMSRRG